jgi:hypothetical protein
MLPLRRSSRKAKRPNYDVDLNVSSYPDGAPANELERVISSLNLQTFPADLYAAADDIIVYSLFATKSRETSYRALKPFQIAGLLGISTADAIEIARICNKHIDRNNPTVDACAAAVMSLRMSFQDLFLRFDDSLLVQWVFYA